MSILFAMTMKDQYKLYKSFSLGKYVSHLICVEEKKVTILETNNKLVSETIFFSEFILCHIFSLIIYYTKIRYEIIIS